MSVAEKLTEELDQEPGRLPHQAHSDREYQVMVMISFGIPLKDIADQLSLTTKTVSTYRSSILEKTKLNNNAELMLYAIRKHLID